MNKEKDLYKGMSDVACDSEADPGILEKGRGRDFQIDKRQKTLAVGGCQGPRKGTSVGILKLKSKKKQPPSGG